MAQGIQAWDGAGNMVLEITDRLTRIMEGVDIVANQGGAVWVPGGEFRRYLVYLFSEFPSGC
ncbi:hypothetical protein [Stenotrophomonas phage CM2]